jgi:hypothetical protein
LLDLEWKDIREDGDGIFVARGKVKNPTQSKLTIQGTLMLRDVLRRLKELRRKRRADRRLRGRQRAGRSRRLGSLVAAPLRPSAPRCTIIPAVQKATLLYPINRSTWSG